MFLDHQSNMCPLYWQMDSNQWTTREALVNYSFFFFNLFFYWRINALQNFAVFCQTSTWISHQIRSDQSLSSVRLFATPCLFMLQDGRWRTRGCLLGGRRPLGEMMAVVKAWGKDSKPDIRWWHSGCDMEGTPSPKRHWTSGFWKNPCRIWHF